MCLGYLILVPPKNLKKSTANSQDKLIEATDKTPPQPIVPNNSISFDFEHNLNALKATPSLNPRYWTLLKKLINNTLLLNDEVEFEKQFDVLSSVIKDFESEIDAFEYVKRGIKTNKKYKPSRLLTIKEKLEIKDKPIIIGTFGNPINNSNAHSLQDEFIAPTSKMEITDKVLAGMSSVDLGFDSRVQDEDYRIFGDIINDYIGINYSFRSFKNMKKLLMEIVNQLGFEYKFMHATGSHRKYMLVNTARNEKYGAATLVKHDTMTEGSLTIYFYQALIYVLKVKKILEQNDPGKKPNNNKIL